jgi:hypothetical protein
VILNVPAPEYSLIEALVEAKRLTVAEALDRRRVEHAAGEVLDEWAKRWLENSVTRSHNGGT